MGTKGYYEKETLDVFTPSITKIGLQKLKLSNEITTSTTTLSARLRKELTSKKFDAETMKNAIKKN